MKKLSVEIADTPSRREIGLMHRKHLGSNEGMLFKFPHSDNLRFWMKNTHIPLDIAFLKEDGTIFQIASMYPMSTRNTVATQPCKYALEVNQGWFKENNIQVGQKLNGLFFKNVRTAQAMPPMPMPPPDGQQGQQPQQEPQKEEVTINMSNKEKIKYAEEHGLKLRILYVSKDGFYVGPRILSPVPQEHNTYPFYMGPEGEYFKGYDESPTISGGNPPWESAGGTPKSFYIDLIQKLEVLGPDGNTIKIIRGQPIEEAEPEIEPNEAEAKKFIKQSIPGLTDDQWNKMKDDVLKNMKKGYDLTEIVNNVKMYFMSLFNKFRKK